VRAGGERGEGEELGGLSTRPAVCGVVCTSEAGTRAFGVLLAGQRRRCCRGEVGRRVLHGPALSAGQPPGVGPSTRAPPRPSPHTLRPPPSPPPADCKWRYMWRVGPRPQRTAFAELNAAPVVPAGLPQWPQLMDSWGGKMLAAVEAAAQMAALGFGLPREALSGLMRQGPHLLAPTGADLGAHGQLGAVVAGYHYDLNLVSARPFPPPRRPAAPAFIWPLRCLAGALCCCAGKGGLRWPPPAVVPGARACEGGRRSAGPGKGGGRRRPASGAAGRPAPPPAPSPCTAPWALRRCTLLHRPPAAG
jgi:hypothetical protein